MSIGPPCSFKRHYCWKDFDCGEPSLNNWLANKAARSEGRSSRTYLVLEDDHKVIAYFNLAAGSVSHDISPKKLRRNMPDPIPVIILGRLAVDTEWSGKGLGQDLLSQAIKMSIEAANLVGVRALVVHALNDKNKNYYLDKGFVLSPLHEGTLILPLDNIKSE